MSEQVKGIPQDLRELYEFLTQDYFVKQGIGHAELEIKPILAIIERIARSEQALAALETRNKELESALALALTCDSCDGEKTILFPPGCNCYGDEICTHLETEGECPACEGTGLRDCPAARAALKGA